MNQENFTIKDLLNELVICSNYCCKAKWKSYN